MTYKFIITILCVSVSFYSIPSNSKLDWSLKGWVIDRALLEEIIETAKGHNKSFRVDMKSQKDWFGIEGDLVSDSKNASEHELLDNKHASVIFDEDQQPIMIKRDFDLFAGSSDTIVSNKILPDLCSVKRVFFKHIGSVECKYGVFQFYYDTYYGTEMIGLRLKSVPE